MASTITTSVVTGGSNSHATTSAEVNAIATDFIHYGVSGPITLNSGSGGTGSFCVNAQGTPAMLVDVKAGSAWITATPTGQTSQKLRAYMSADYTNYTISSNSSGSTKYDWIYLKVDPTAANSPASDASDVTSLYTSRSSSNSTDNGTPPTYGILLAVVTVANGASSITNSNISDKRTTATFRSSPAASGVNSIDVTTATTGNKPGFTAQGSDTNIGMFFAGKGTGAGDFGSLISNAVTTNTNAGTGGGSKNLLNLGGLKILWGTTTAQSLVLNGNLSLGVTFGTTFTTAPSMMAIPYNPPDNRVSAVITGTTTTTGTILLQSNGSATNNVAAMWFAIGI